MSLSASCSYEFEGPPVFSTHVQLIKFNKFDNYIFFINCINRYS